MSPCDEPKTCGRCGNTFSGYGNVCPRCGAPVPHAAGALLSPSKIEAATRSVASPPARNDLAKRRPTSAAYAAYEAATTNAERRAAYAAFTRADRNALRAEWESSFAAMQEAKLIEIRGEKHANEKLAHRDRFRIWAGLTAILLMSLVISVLISHGAASTIRNFFVVMWALVWIGSLTARLYPRVSRWPLALVGAIFAISIVAYPVFYSMSDSYTTYVREGAIAKDGSISSAVGRGAASHHGGVRKWITSPVTKTRNEMERWMATFGTLFFLLPVIAFAPILFLERLLFGCEPLEKNDRNA